MGKYDDTYDILMWSKVYRNCGGPKTSYDIAHNKERRAEILAMRGNQAAIDDYMRRIARHDAVKRKPSQKWLPIEEPTPEQVQQLWTEYMERNGTADHDTFVKRLALVTGDTPLALAVRHVRHMEIYQPHYNLP